MNRFLLGGLMLAMLAVPRLAPAQDKGKEIFKEEGKLADTDPRDKVFEKSFKKILMVKLDANQFIRIDLKSTDFDAYLRLEDPAGKVLAEDDDSGGFPDARIIYKVPVTGIYKLVVTSYESNKAGKYTLSIVEATRRDSLVYRAQKLVLMDKKEKAEYVADLKKYLAENGANLKHDDLSLAAGIAIGLEKNAPELAADTYSDFGALLAKSSDPAVTKFAPTLIGAARRLKLQGQDMVVKGTTMEGKPFDWKAYRGKIVLVDFWATWCGPCRAEFPNVRKLLDTYKDQGFEVVGVSIDQNRIALEKYLEKEKLPWVCLHEKDAKTNPMSEYYGIMMIPLAVLVDRDGKVISTRARGAELGRLLEKHIGTTKTPAK